MFNLSLLICAAADTESNGSINDSAKLIGRLGKQFSAWFEAQKEHLLVALFITAIAVLAALLIRFVFGRLVRRAFDRVSPLTAQAFAKLAAPLAWLAFFIGLSLANQAVDLPGKADMVLDKTLYALFIITFVSGAIRLIGVFDAHFAAKHAADADGMHKLIGDLIRRAVKTLVWVIAVLFIAQNIFRFNVTALITGAGVAGLAIAFAAQNTIANIFGALSIVSDKIFKVGDFVDVNGKRGSVEAVGFRSTKLRSLDGTVWNLPNRLVADAPIENISQRKNIKFTFTLSLVYSTTPEQMQQALDILKEIFAAFPGFDNDKAPAKYSFSAFSSSSLDIGVIVWFNTRDFMEAQGMKQQLNMTILDRFNAAGLSFAYPSVTNYIVNRG